MSVLVISEGVTIVTPWGSWARPGTCWDCRKTVAGCNISPERNGISENEVSGGFIWDLSTDGFCQEHHMKKMNCMKVLHKKVQKSLDR